MALSSPLSNAPAPPARSFSFSATLRERTLHLQSTWGLFSPERIDSGTQLLLNQLPLEADTPITALDLGCGYGMLGLAIAAASSEHRVHLVDKDFVAVEYATKNAAANGLTNTQCYLSNGLEQVDVAARFDLIVSNLPAKVGNELIAIFTQDAHARLPSGGSFMVVTISRMRTHIKRTFLAHFGNYEKVAQGKTHTVSRAVRR